MFGLRLGFCDSASANPWLGSVLRLLLRSVRGRNRLGSVSPTNLVLFCASALLCFVWCFCVGSMLAAVLLALLWLHLASFIMCLPKNYLASFVVVGPAGFSWAKQIGSVLPTKFVGETEWFYFCFAHEFN